MVQSRLGGPPIPWPIIWASLGTPLSDATEERNWRKMLHRAIFTRNQDPKAPSHACRLNCGCRDASMIHLVQCRYTKAYWIAVMTFVYKILKVPHEHFIQTLIILNISRGTLINTEARAFTRHAFNAFYRDIAMVDTHNKRFNWKKTFKQAMTTYHRAVLR